MPNLVRLNFFDLYGDLNSIIAVLAEHCPDLSELVFRQSDQLPLSCIPDLMKLKSLVALRISNLTSLAEAHPPLGTLVKCGTFGVSTETSHLESVLFLLPNLEYIDYLQ